MRDFEWVVTHAHVFERIDYTQFRWQLLKRIMIKFQHLHPLDIADGLREKRQLVVCQLKSKQIDQQANILQELGQVVVIQVELRFLNNRALSASS